MYVSPEGGDLGQYVLEKTVRHLWYVMIPLLYGKSEVFSARQNNISNITRKNKL